MKKKTKKHLLLLLTGVAGGLFVPCAVFYDAANREDKFLFAIVIMISALWLSLFFCANFIGSVK